jgi:hypothetical protein
MDKWFATHKETKVGFILLNISGWKMFMHTGNNSENSELRYYRLSSERDIFHVIKVVGWQKLVVMQRGSVMTYTDKVTGPANGRLSYWPLRRTKPNDVAMYQRITALCMTPTHGAITVIYRTATPTRDCITGQFWPIFKYVWNPEIIALIKFTRLSFSSIITLDGAWDFSGYEMSHWLKFSIHWNIQGNYRLT